MSERYICVHGHFYQPPRENPWLEAIELQDSAFPYHDWNERITAECYAPNGASRMLDAQTRIVRIVNNYGDISFNFGPTLLAWLEDNDAETYGKVLQGERESRQKFGGHGSAIAQPYNHMIMPLANSRDKLTQVLWGQRDFEHRFGRKAEGMWLPETAVDIETLEILARTGVKFTILAPHQANRVRETDADAWQDTGSGRIDPTRPYVHALPSGADISLFFYDAPASQAVAFEGLLKDGSRFATRLLGLFNDSRAWPQLAHIATDGETYGHHHRHGDMALAYALDQIRSKNQATLINYAQYLALYKPTAQVEISENTSWSCAHGIERWRSNCGCSTGGEPGWTQAWRGPLRAALDWLRDSVVPLYESAAAELLKDPWAARDDYIDVILDRSPLSVRRFLDRHALAPLGEEDTVRALGLLELQRHAMLMYTSCGWFFNEVSGIETVQVLEYAGRVAQLTRDLLDTDLETNFCKLLSEAKSNVVELNDACTIYEVSVKPQQVDLLKVGAHYAISSLFEPHARRSRVYCYSVEEFHREQLNAGPAGLLIGRARITSDITRETAAVAYGVLHLGDHNINGGVRPLSDDSDYHALITSVSRAFATADLPSVIRLLDRNFPGSAYSVKSLFRDEQRKILDLVLESTIAEAESAYRSVYERHAPLMRFLAELDSPMPTPFLLAAAFVLNKDLRRAFEDPDMDLQRAGILIGQAQSAGVELEDETLGFALEETLVKIAQRLHRTPGEPVLLDRLLGAVTLAQSLPFEVDLWKVQNIYYEIAEKAFKGMMGRASGEDPAPRRWVEQFKKLGELLKVAVV